MITNIDVNTIPTKPKIDMDKKSITHFIIMIIFMFGFRYLPAPGAVTIYGMAMIGLFIGLVWGWTFLGLLMPSLIGAFVLAFSGFEAFEEAFMAMFNNGIVLMLLVGMLVFDAINQSGAADFMLAKILGNERAQDNPQAIVSLLLLGALVICCFGGQMVMMIAIPPIINVTLKKCGYERGNRFSVLLMCGYFMAIQLGMCFRPFMGWGLMTVGSIMSITKSQISYGIYMVAMVIIYVIFILTYPKLMQLVKCDFSKLVGVDFFEAFNVKQKKLNLEQKLVLGGLLVFIGIVVVMSFIPNTALGQQYSKVGVLGMMVLYWIFVVFIKVGGKPLINMRKASENYNWDMVILFAVAVLVSNCLTSQDTGVSAWLTSIVSPVFANTSPLLFLIALAAVTVVLSNFANNIAVCFIMINLVSAMYLNGFNVNLLAASMIIINASVMSAFLTPASSLPGAILHSSDSLSSTSLYKWVPLVMAYSVLLLAIVLIPLSLIV